MQQHIPAPLQHEFEAPTPVVWSRSPFHSPVSPTVSPFQAAWLSRGRGGPAAGAEAGSAVAVDLVVAVHSTACHEVIAALLSAADPKAVRLSVYVYVKGALSRAQLRLSHPSAAALCCCPLLLPCINTTLHAGSSAQPPSRSPAFVATEAATHNWRSFPLLAISCLHVQLLTLHRATGEDEKLLVDAVPSPALVRVQRLSNVGRCDHTYLHHIATRYDSLSELTIFLKDTVAEHVHLGYSSKLLSRARCRMRTVPRPVTSHHRNPRPFRRAVA